ncbi:universal stress protein [Virgisporangium ochraceum]|uniref:Universal stress protein n=1 Tax=Virgisporangium ochraceum TaxID=65505 RepID=A0A8J4A2R0_9ACTN|nr:universal stress protein [Virgisporangium ochraceum]GIJ71706.1 universal stress protein [Virgisporangium ochraceum]
MSTEQIVVGVDASAVSWLALRWATAEAVRRGVSLRIVHAFHAHLPDVAYNVLQAEANALKQATAVVDDAVEDVRRRAPGVDVRTETVSGGAAAALLEAARPGDLVVVGNRGHSELAATLAGSTCQQVAMHAPASVAVIRPQMRAEAGPVVVGHDGSRTAEAVLLTAFDQADARDCGLVVVRAFRPSTPPWPAGAPSPTLFTAATAQAALTVGLERVVAPLTDRYPKVKVEVRVAGGDPAQLLVEASRTARLVVVGSRGHGGFTGLLLGSVGLHLLHHAQCGVLISRP